jgi:ribosome biogenesis GTPase
MMKEGIVLKTTGSRVHVESDGDVISCRLRGQLRLKELDSTNPVAVGDIVDFEMENHTMGIIFGIHKRSNYIIRKSINLSKQTQILAANIDRAWLVVTPVLPKTSTGFIDRFIAAAESFHIPVSLVFNKADLFKTDLEEVQRDYLDIYEPLGYTCYKVSAAKGEGIEELKMAIKDKVNLFSGHSGVGKSSLLNALQPTLNLRTGRISKQHHKGIHTTTFAQMHKLDAGGYIIDTPGIKEFVNIEFVPQEISHYFVEMRDLITECHFNNCLHDTESQCAVKAAVEAGKIHASRYYNYLSMLHQEDHYR